MVSGVFPVPPSATFPTLITIGLVFSVLLDYNHKKNFSPLSKQHVLETKIEKQKTQRPLFYKKY